MTAPLEVGDGNHAAQGASAPGRRPRILVADDLAVLRDGLRARLSAMHAVELLQDIDNVSAILRLVESLKPDVVVLEMWLAGTAGLPAIHELKQSSPATRIMVLTVDETEDYVRAAFQAGADGFVLKTTALTEMLAGIETILHGKRFISEAVSQHIVNRYLQQAEQPQGPRELGSLTAREREVLRMIAEGRRNREIAGSLFLSVKTVEKHRSNLMNKLDLHNTAALTSFAVEHHLVGLSFTREPRNRER
jgi:DNA-binding NarL/FixJ family response regulator